jgi:hypothetical protein
MDKVLVVARLDRLTADKAVETREVLERSGADMLGVVVIGARVDVSPYYISERAPMFTSAPVSKPPAPKQPVAKPSEPKPPASKPTVPKPPAPKPPTSRPAAPKPPTSRPTSPASPRGSKPPPSSS